MTTLRHGDRGQDVRVLQQRLNQTGAGLYVDGHFGDATEIAVRNYQSKIGLVSDGIAGPKTLAALAGADCSCLLRHSTLATAAARLGIELAAILAVNEVESLGSGFLDNGKPKILYERHIMYRQLAKPRHSDDNVAELKAHAVELAASQPNLVNPRPGGYVGGTAEHQRLANAKLIDDTCALESASWGGFQIMGYHAVRLGYASVQEFATRMAKDENEQFEAFVRFLEADPALLKALRAKKWATFARGYNGPDYERNLYDTKLQRAYQRHAAGCSMPEAA
ncbi:N-acetylmuramidase family protein [Pseudomonas sp. TNT2022 ID1044]|uniref:N-acetylmuramidase family protein n=1 Tax=Pseudomonas sp. TNT2022 ID1044 TaxID=2942636 RepID=UPI0023620014|nr:N-acetylmuramidase family protein [Pseudomonas sp. TNT2022 ID1044]MDD0998831.1 N-acetylmuramidase family protein [Pseudomonas sp. TNT2022 ID1044]